ncbi:aldehyde dehydrogenase [Bacillus salipaludis]|uniref:3-sulfolactaldehyde dehydrogenase n=1 Tax=Bacillus salipaludis TaxID=2547811 RepID=A0A4R5VY05_9BACI|nr:aldehyde dehydrogenase family protein [Bacillus salipaludis]MDQ6594906.1 aldehyde dehydrogenase family protein [Bacillus salipaludis]TDK64212.1 aldehyde dehydrogenase [Bacillus salipaludis]
MEKTVSKAILNAKTYINGMWMDGEGELVEVVSPVNGEIIGNYRNSSIEQVNLAIKSAKEAQKEWANVPLLDKLDLLKKAEELGRTKYGEEMARYITLEMGKTITEAREEVYELGISNFEHAIGEVQRFRGSTLPSTFERTNNKRIHITHAPIGVVSVITPWNFPVSLSAELIPYALAVGNTVVFKPSEITPFSTELLIRLFDEAGFPPGVVNLVQGKGDVGNRIVTHEDVRGVCFTGSAAVGEKIAQAAGLKRTLLELGGNGPQIVMEDANLEEAVEAAINGCFYNAGQVCTAAERILVHESIHDEFVDLLVERTKKVRLGNPLEDGTEMGPLSGQPVVDKMNEHIKDAVNKGAKVVYGGNHSGLYYEPTILVNANQSMLLGKEETFGPIAPIIKFKTREEAVEIANDTPYGLTSSVFTSGLADAWYMADNLEHGTVHINESTNYWDFLAPFGGMKNSGNGRILSQWVFQHLTEVKQITFDPTKAKRK